MIDPSGSQAPFLVSKTAQLQAKDNSESLKFMKKMLERLKDQELDGLRDAIEKKIKELAESSGKIDAVTEKMSQIMPEPLAGNTVSSTDIADGMAPGSAATGALLSHIGIHLSEMDIEALVQFVMTAAAKGHEQDLKAMLEEVEKLKKKKARARTLRLLTGAAVLILGAGAFFAAPFFSPPQAGGVTPIPQVDLPLAPLAAPPGGSISESLCTIEFTPPAGAENMPASGPVDVEWLRVPKAFSYTFQVTLPAGGGAPWLITTDEASRRLYMENFPAAGQYEISIDALDDQGAVLCTGVLSFEKPASDEPAAHQKESEGGPNCNPYGLFDPC